MSQALRSRFESIRQREVERLDKKLRGLSDDDRRSAESIITDIVRAIVRVPEQALSEDASAPTLEALVHLFGLEGHPSIAPL